MLAKITTYSLLNHHSSNKVDLKCIEPAVGGFYYRDHLSPLKVEFKKSQSGFTTGDKVCVQQLTKEKLQELSAGHGGWNADMEKVRLLVVVVIVVVVVVNKKKKEKKKKRKREHLQHEKVKAKQGLF